MDGRHTLLIGVASVVLDVYESRPGSRKRDIRLVANTYDVVESREAFAECIAALGSLLVRGMIRQKALRLLPQDVPEEMVTGSLSFVRWEIDGERTEIEAFGLELAAIERALLSKAG